MPSLLDVPWQDLTDDTRAGLQLALKVHKRKRENAAKKRAEVKSVVDKKIGNCLTWLQHHTKTVNKHWIAEGRSSPYEPFPPKPYFAPILERLRDEPILFIPKSRDMMLSWVVSGFFTHLAMTTPGQEVLFQSLTEDKAAELVDYSKCLYRNSDEDIKTAYPLIENIERQSWLELNFANGSRIIGIPHGEDKIRSYHPTALFMDEAAFVPDAGESYNAGVAACQKIVVVSSANVGWFESVCVSAT